jgi:SSS family solute:Na+ symporter
MHRTKSSEDYLLGGRNLKSKTVGLSLFATLLSTITYIAIPGEMIMKGPMFLGQLFAIPIIYYVIGYLFIPLIMQLKITSAYEILEKRFDSSIRTLGAFIFLLLRLLWMAVIIYVTTDKILIPLTGLDPSSAPWICIILGIVTLLYTSMGGLRAVVLTDAVQTFILFGGAFLSLFIITIHLGGLSEWWPNAWAEHWEAPRFGFQTSGQLTFT